MTVIAQERCCKRQKQMDEQKIKDKRSRSLSNPRRVAAPEPYDPLAELISVLPLWYIKIHERFPHLSFKEAAELAKLIRAAPNYTITTHSGTFESIERPKGGGHKQSEKAWRCCHGIVNGYTSHCPPGTCDRNGILTASPYIGNPTCQESPDRKKTDPCGKCDKPITFSLEASDFY